MLEPSNHFCMFPSLGVAVTTVESVLDGRSFWPNAMGPSVDGEWTTTWLLIDLSGTWHMGLSMGHEAFDRYHETYAN